MNFSDKKVKQVLFDNHIYTCLACGKCSASCPRMLAGKEYSPRLLAQKLIAKPEEEEFIENSLWECLTCGLCEERCPSGVEISKFVAEMRAMLAADKGVTGYRAHDGAIHSWMRLMTSPDLEQNRLDWIDDSLKVSAKGPIAYFTGCAPYFDVFFASIKVDTLSIARDSIKLLNFLDITPVIMADERCCGHDLLWTGDRENFETLCRLNYDEFKSVGIEEIIVSCPECYDVLNRHMPEVIDGFDIKITLLIDLLEKEIHKGGLSFKELEAKITYQDPCRLGRVAGRYDEPRTLLSKIPNLTLNEMENTGRGAICCGNNGFINCDAYSKQIQIERLKEVKATKADFLVTACPKCMIHLTCAMNDPIRNGSLALEIRDLSSVLSDQIIWSDEEKPRKKHR